MLISILCAVGTLSGAWALPSPVKRSPYVVKERHEVPRHWAMTGPASKSETIHLQIGLKQSNEGEIERHLLEISDPSHHRYGQHLSAADVYNVVAPSAETTDLVVEWLADYGVTEPSFSPARDWISIVVPIEKAEELLQTSYSKYRHFDGTTVSRAPEWSLPAHLLEHIDVVQPTTSFYRGGPEMKISDPLRGEQSWSMAWWDKIGKEIYHQPGGSLDEICNITFTTPLCIRTLYGTIDYTPQVPGKNRIGLNNYLNETNNRNDVSLFLKAFRPEAAPAAEEFQIVIIDDAPNPQGPYTPAQIENGDNEEADLDAENILSVVWPTPLTAFSTGGEPPFIPDINTPTDTNEPYLSFQNYILAQSSVPQVISSSYGDDEQSVPYSYAKRVCAGFAQLGARGVSLMVSSGDAGVGPDGACLSNTSPSYWRFLAGFPASCPWVTAVGATQGFYPDEQAVERFASGGGFSDYFPQPSYQKAIVQEYIAGLGGLHNGLYNKTGRGYPDVAAQGNHDAIVWAGNITTVGGTSASSPTFSGVISLVNDYLIAKGKPQLGFLNPWLYSEGYKALTDITNGSSYGCNSSGFPAKQGWDAVSGWGTPNFQKLVDIADQQSGGWW